jgi:hypothetical protein
MRIRAAGASIDRDRVVLVENGCDLIEVYVTRPNDAPPGMNNLWELIVPGRIGDIAWYDEHGHAAFCQCCLARRDCPAPGLLRRPDHLAIDSVSLEHVIEIDPWIDSNPKSCRTIWVAIRMTGAPLRLAS